MLVDQTDMVDVVVGDLVGIDDEDGSPVGQCLGRHEVQELEIPVARTVVQVDRPVAGEVEAAE